MSEENSKSLPVQLQPKMVFGLRPCPGNIHFTNAGHVIYTAAAVLVIHDYETNKQRFLRFPDHVQVTYVIVSGHGKYLGLAETHRGERTVINTYDLATYKKRHTVYFPVEVPTKAVAAMAFTHDSKGLAVLTQEPDAHILLVFFDKGHVMGRVSHSTHQLAVARCIACSPVDSGTVAIGGDLTFKLLNRTEKGFAPLGSIKGDGVTITTMAWLTNDVMIAGTDERDLLVVENGDLKLVFDAQHVTLIDLAVAGAAGDGGEGDDSKKDMQALLQERRRSLRVVKGESPVLCLRQFKNGFCFALHNTVHVFRREGTQFKKASVLTLPITLYAADLYQIQELAINAAEDTCIATCRHSQVYICPLFVPESVQIEKDLQFQPLGQPLHIAEIVSMSTCAWKPIVITASKDQTIRIWNYSTGKVELVKKYLVDIVVIALHPSGLFVAVGFCDQLRLMEVLLDDLKVIKTYNFPRCQEAVFSHKGHLFAVSYGNTISIISVFTFDVVQTLRGHNGLVLSLSWCDELLVSAGDDGAIYQWDVFTGKRINEVVQKGVEYRAVVTMQNHNVLAITNSGVLREICNSEIIRETKIPQQPPLTAMALARSDLMLFVCSERGHLFSVQLPFMETGGGTCTNFRFFDRPVTQLCLTYDDNCLVSASGDGTLVLWRLLHHDLRRGAMDERLGSCTDVLIPRQSLLDKVELVASLEERIRQQSEEFRYQSEQREGAHRRQVQEIHDSYSKAIEELKSRNQQLEREHVEELNLVAAKNAEVEEGHQRRLMDLETDLHRKIIALYDKNRELADSFHKLRDESNAKLRKTAGYLEDTIESMEGDFRQQIESRRERIQQLVDCNETLKKEFVEYCRQERAQFERQVARLRLDYETRLLHEQEVNNRWRNEAGVVSKKWAQTSREIAKYKEDLLEVQQANGDLQAAVEEQQQGKQELRTVVMNLQAQLQERDRVIEGLQEKVKQLVDEQRVLEDRVVELQQQLVPRDRELRRRSEELRILSTELEALAKANGDLERVLLSTRQRQESLAQEAKQKAGEVHRVKTFLTRVIADIHLLNSVVLQPEELKKQAVALFEKYQDQDTDDLQLDSTLVQELHRQMSHQMQKAKRKDGERTQLSTVTDREQELLTDNRKLIADLQDARARLNKSEERVRKLEQLFGSSKKGFTPKEVRVMLDKKISQGK